jgi:hypothetical protein
LRAKFKLPVGIFLYGRASEAGEVGRIAAHADVVGEMGYDLFLEARGDYGLAESVIDNCCNVVSVESLTHVGSPRKPHPLGGSIETDAMPELTENMEHHVHVVHRRGTALGEQPRLFRQDVKVEAEPVRHPGTSLGSNPATP